MGIAKFICEDTFLITGRGLVMAGILKDGTFEKDWLVKFNQTANHPEIIRKVKAIEMIRTIQGEKIGFLLETFDDNDLKTIRTYNIKNEEIYIVKEIEDFLI